MTTLERERCEIHRLFDQVERLEDLRERLASRLSDDEAEEMAAAVDQALDELQPVRVPIASDLLELDDKTVRSWLRDGLLTEADTTSSRTHLDPKRLHEVLHLVRELRETGKTRGLLDAVWFRLQDQALLDREDLAESLEQMHRGEVVKA